MGWICYVIACEIELVLITTINSEEEKEEAL